MNELTIDGIKMDYPSSWNELSLQQLREFAHLITQGYNLTELRTVFLFKLLRIQRTAKQPFQFLIQVKRGRKKFAISDDDFSMLVSSLDFIFSKKHDQPFVNSRLTKNHFPKVGKLCGPSDACYNICFLEWHTAELEFARYNRLLEEKYLDRLIATLYRPASGISTKDVEYNGDLRQPFNDHLIDDIAQETAKLPAITKYIIYLFYQGCRIGFIERFDRVFSKGDSETSTKDKTPLFLQMTDELNLKDVTKNKEIHSTNIMEVLTRLQREKIKAEEMEEQMKKLKNK